MFKLRFSPLYLIVSPFLCLVDRELYTPPPTPSNQCSKFVISEHVMKTNEIIYEFHRFCFGFCELAHTVVHSFYLSPTNRQSISLSIDPGKFIERLIPSTSGDISETLKFMIRTTALIYHGFMHVSFNHKF